MIDPELLEDAPTVDARILRQFAGVWLVLFGSLAGWSVYQGEDGRAVVFGALALAAGPLGLVRPYAIQPLFSTLIAVTKPIGLVVTRIIIAVIFYGLFTPLSLLFKIIGRDALVRRRSMAATTYWRRRSAPAEARRYFRQY